MSLLQSRLKLNVMLFYSCHCACQCTTCSVDIYSVVLYLYSCKSQPGASYCKLKHLTRGNQRPVQNGHFHPASSQSPPTSPYMPCGVSFVPKQKTIQHTINMLNCLNLSSVQRTSTSVTKMEPDWNSEASADAQHLCLAHTKTHSSVWINQCLDWKEQTCTLTAGLRALFTGYVGKTNTGNYRSSASQETGVSGECFTLTLVKRFVLTSRLTVWSSSIDLWTGAAEQESSRERAGCGQVTTRCWVLQPQTKNDPNTQ